MFRSIVSAFSIFALVFVQTAYAADWTNGLSVEEINSRKAAAIAELDEFSKVAKSLRENIDRTQFDIEELLASLDYDAERIVEFVETEIFYEPYEGALRGASGTLLGRAGNSLDQSVLLASMLRDAGYQARISQFELDVSAAENLIDSIKIERNLPEHVFKDGTSVAGLVEGKFPELAAERDAELAAYKAEVDETFAYILDTLNENGIEIGDKNFRTNLISEAQDYFAVEFRETVSEGWQLAHPAAADLFGESFDVPVSQIFEAAVPEALQHQFRFSVHMRANTGADVPTETTLFSWTRPTANLTSVDLEFTIVPLNTDAVREALSALFEQGAFTQEDYLRVIAETQNLEEQVFVPIWNGAPAEGALAFDLNGTVVPLSASMQQASELFRTLGGAVGNAQSALAGLGTDEEFEVRTESVWIEYAFLEPGNEWEVHEREIYNSDPVREPWGARADVYTLTGAYAFMLSMGEMNKSYLADNYLAQIIAENALIEDIIGTFPEPSLDEMSKLAVEHTNATNRRHDLLRLHANFDFPFVGPGTRVFKPGPSLTVLSDYLIAETEVGHSLFGHVVDIVRNERSALRMHGDDIAHDPLGSMKAGVWESFIESQHTRSIAQGFGKQSQTVRSAFVDLKSQFSQRDINRLPVVLDASVSSEHKLKRGELALFSTTGKEKERVWWKVDPKSGSALAIGSGGRGESLTEYIITNGLAASKAFILTRFSHAFLFYSLCQAAAIAKEPNADRINVSGCLSGSLVVMQYGIKGPVLNRVLLFVISLLGPLYI